MELWMVSVLVGTAGLASAVVFNFVECVRLGLEGGLRSFPHSLDQKYLGIAWLGIRCSSGLGILRAMATKLPGHLKTQDHVVSPCLMS